ncbi:mast/stem cell growth factor receptor kita-like isoform X2 [Homarus americanus]|uniref:mast/stem cell growth factor receptor kita-like isoform X2 n=1 Tax=Homarus americanus TaxID=6706 RepID=UPI001C48ECB3|nr:mast/stem cell growth factor receptor kita-like isoform X2 [Homarus americanus]
MVPTEEDRSLSSALVAPDSSPSSSSSPITGGLLGYESVGPTPHSPNSSSPASNSSSPAHNSGSSSHDSLSSTHKPVISTPLSLSSTHIIVNSTSLSLSSSYTPISSTPLPLSSTPHHSSSYDPTLQVINSVSNPNPNHEPLIPAPNSTTLILQPLNSSPSSSDSTPESLNSSTSSLDSTPESVNSTAGMFNPPNVLLSTPELVTTTHLPTFRTSASSSPDDPSEVIQDGNSTARTQDLEREPQEPLTSDKNSTTRTQESILDSATRTPDLDRGGSQASLSPVMNLTSTTPPSGSKRRQSEPNLKGTTSSPRVLISTTPRARNSSKIHPSKRKPSLKFSRSMTQRSAPSDIQNTDPQVDSRVNVCHNDPCGPGISCHPTPQGKTPFECICSNGEKRLQPNETCQDIHIAGVPQPRPIAPSSHPNKSKNLVSAAVVVALVMVVVLMLVYWRRKNLYTLLRHRQREKKSGPQSPGSLAKSSSLLTHNFASNPNYYAQSPDNLPLHTLAVQLIDSDQISFIGVLGEGCFGKVYKGTYGPRCPPESVSEVTNDEEQGEGGGTGEEEEVNLTVAVKVLKESAGVEAEADFRREVEIMSAFKHENILSLIGIVATELGKTPWMVFEYMAYGDLAEVLRSCSKPFYSNDSPIKSLSREDLLNISVQIASGMEYLSSQHFVHRDLACRNCLVGENLTVKISDFGMSRDVYTCDYYKIGGSRLLPVRWMAHESIMYGKFTLESDVWSFAVVLWEIYSFGKQPYYGNPNENVIKLIFQGILLSPPDTCPPQVCDVMRRCWATDPNDRLKFPEILARLKRLQEEQRTTALPSPPPSPGPAVPPPITYSELCLHDEGGLELDSDQYLMPRMAERREYITVLSDV